MGSLQGYLQRRRRCRDRRRIAHRDVAGPYHRRKGRFDEIFFLDLPQTQERQQIFKIHIQEFRPNTWESFDYNKLAQLSESFSGAEIKQSIIEAMYHAFYEQREFTTEDICLALNELIPLAQLESTQTIKLQNWASSGRIRLASSNSIYI